MAESRNGVVEAITKDDRKAIERMRTIRDRPGLAERTWCRAAHSRINTEVDPYAMVGFAPIGTGIMLWR